MGLLLHNCFEVLWVMLVVVALHELGHFAVAYRLGLPVSSVEVGVGPKLFQFMWKGVWFRLRLVPISGLVKTCWLATNRWKSVPFFSAGPLANFLLALALYLWLADTSEQTVLRKLMVASWYIGLYNLVPLSLWGQDSDGLQIIEELCKKRSRRKVAD